MKDKKLYLTNEKEGNICEVRKVAYKIDGAKELKDGVDGKKNGDNGKKSSGSNSKALLS